jgi:AcrR family transcriptional regulator
MDSRSVTTVRWRGLDGKNRPRVFVPFGTICSVLCGIDGKERMDKPDRRIRRTRESLHKALISLALEKHYDSITVQEVLDRADVGRSTFYTHFQSMDELLILGTQELRKTLHAALEKHRTSAKPPENVIAFSRAMFDHAYGYRNVYFALLNTGAWPIVRQQLQDVLEELIRRECKAEIAKLKTANSDVPVDLFVHYLTSAFFAVLIWWMDRRSRLTPSQIDEVFRSLVLPTVHAVLG